MPNKRVVKMDPCKFYDSDGERLWGGYTDWSRWNGFLNVAVDEVTFKRLWMSWYGQIIMRNDLRDCDDYVYDPDEIPKIHTTHGVLRDLGNMYATVGEHDFD